MISFGRSYHKTLNTSPRLVENEIFMDYHSHNPQHTIKRAGESPPNQSTAKTPRKPTPGRLEKLSMRPSICASSPSCSPTSKPSRPSSVSSSLSCCVKRSASWMPMESGSYGAPLVEDMFFVIKPCIIQLWMYHELS